MAEFKVGNLAAAQGQKVRGFVKVVNTDMEMPVTLINGVKEGKTVVITGGTHGGEYPGVETSIRLAREITPDQVVGRIAIVHPVNTVPFLAKTQYVNALDGKNLNRMFPGKALGTVSERIAYTVSTELQAKADFYMDLHGGDIHEWLIPFVIYPTAGPVEAQELSKKAAAEMGLPMIIASASTTGSFGAAAAAGHAGFLAEIGSCGRWSEEEVSQYMLGVKNVLRYLGVMSGAREELGRPAEYSRMVGINAEQTGCWYAAVKPGDKVTAGQKIGEIRDYFGEKLGDYAAPQAGTIVYVITSLAINAGDPLAALV
jgi:predicted deacylase